MRSQEKEIVIVCDFLKMFDCVGVEKRERMVGRQEVGWLHLWYLVHSILQA